jgi:hypothetical protein
MKIKGAKNINLEKDFKNYIDNIQIINNNLSERWDTYNLIIGELKTLGLEIIINEIKYRITDGENPNTVMLDIINRDLIGSNIIWVLKKRIEEFYEEDYLNQFI